MSRAFVKEPDAPASDDLPDRPQGDHPNYVTPEGLALLHAELHRLQERRSALADAADDPMKQEQVAQLERDVRYCQGRIDRAVVVDLAKQPADEVHFGAIVQVKDDQGEVREFAIVGEDEADVTHGKVSWISPLAKAMLGAKVGDTVTWQRPAGDVALEITRIRYP